MEIGGSNRFGTLSPDSLREFEHKLAIRLPEDYGQFLLKHNGGDPSPVNIIDFEDQTGRTSSDVQFIYGIHDDESWASLAWHLQNLKGRIVREGLPIAGDSAGNQYLLITGGTQQGQIYFWDHELETGPPGYQNMSYVAGSFTEFMAKLYQAEQPDASEVDRMLVQNDLPGLERLLARGYDLEKTDVHGRTLIENAAIQNRTEIIQMLFDRGAQLRNALDYARCNHRFFEEYKASVELLERLQDGQDH